MVRTVLKPTIKQLAPAGLDLIKLRPIPEFKFLRCPDHPNTPQGYENLYRTISWNLWVIGWAESSSEFQPAIFRDQNVNQVFYYIKSMVRTVSVFVLIMLVGRTL